MSPNGPSLSGWGLLAAPGREIRSPRLESMARQAPLTRGLGRSYGDCSLPPADRPIVASSTLADRILEFDRESGRLRAEAGLSLFDLRRLFLHRGWFIPVSPGTQFVTLGGVVAADVHGKNHHRAGSIGRHVLALRLLLADGQQVVASREQNADLFRATLGGMGLTGHILEVELRLERVPSPWVRQQSRRFEALEDLVAALQEASAEWPFTVAWIDLLARGEKAGRGVLLCGRWATPEEAPAHRPRRLRRLRIPFTAPNLLLNRPLMRLYTLLQYRRHSARPRTSIVHPERYFYPLDGIQNWNRLYGQRGFIQYQCVLPSEAGAAGLKALIDRMRELDAVPYLTVLKDFGAQGEGLLSFPARGLTLCLDFPVDSGTQGLVDSLNELVLAWGGRIYLAKDALTRGEHFRRMEPRLAEFERVKRRWDPEGRIQSRQWQRLVEGGTGEVETGQSARSLQLPVAVAGEGGAG